MSGKTPRIQPPPQRQSPRPLQHNPDTSNRSDAISAARAAAFEILLRVATNDAHSDDLLHSPRVNALSPEDRNLTTALVMGVLRWQIALDARIAKLLTRPGQQLAPQIAIALRLGAFQLLYMDRIPPHAAVHESVELCRAAGQPHAAGMVNAILRAVARQTTHENHNAPAETAKRHLPLFESPAAFAERLGHPAWLVERWVANYGREAALAIAEHNQREPGEAALFPAEELSAAMPQIDDGSRLVAELAAAALPAQRDHTPRVWDCCAAPGGKTLVLAERLPKAHILATDVSAKRLAPMAERIAPTGHAARIICDVMDAAEPAVTSRRDQSDAGMLFDLILCDVPCSGTGTLSRNPEIRHRLRPEDLARQSARQIAILRGALSKLAPGGRLLYSTCSLEPEENEQVVAAALANSGSAFCQLPIAPFLSALAGYNLLPPISTAELTRTAVRGSSLRTLPGIHPCDGFFAALIERN